MLAVSSMSEKATPLPFPSTVVGRRAVVLIAYCVAAFFVFSSIVAFSVTKSTLQPALNLTDSESSLLTAVPVLTSAGLRVPVTLITRSAGGRGVGAVLSFITSLALFVSAAIFCWVTIVPSLYPLFVVLGLVIGCGSATINSGIIHCSWWWPIERQGFVAGAFLCSATIGSAIFGAFSSPMISGAGAAALFLLWGCTVLMAGVIIALFCPDPPYIQVCRQACAAGFSVEPLRLSERISNSALYKSISKHIIAPTDDHSRQVKQIDVKQHCTTKGQEVFPTRAFLDDLRRSVTSFHSWCMISVAAVTLGCYLALLVWVFPFFTGAFSIPPADAGLILFGYGIASSLSRIPTGLIIDRFSPWIVASVTITICIGGFVCLAASPSFGLSVFASMVCAVTTAASNTCCYKLVGQQCPDSTSGTIGWMETFGSLLGFVLPLIFSAIQGQSGSLRLGMIVPACLLALCYVPLYLSYRRPVRSTPLLSIPSSTAVVRAAKPTTTETSTPWEWPVIDL